MKETKPWHEDDFFWETWGPLMFTQERIASTKDEVDEIVKLTKAEPGAHFLDLCCGIGRHSLELARRGFQVTGVDRTVSYLEKARNQAEKENLDIEFVRGDMRTFSRKDCFDLVISMYTSFSFFEDPEEDKKVIENIYTSLKPGGKCIIQTHGKETLARIFQERDWHEQDGVLMLVERKVNQNWGWMQNHFIVFKDSERIEGKFSHRLYCGTEMAALLTGCGFSKVDIYGDLDGSPYDNKARFMITLGQK